MSQDLKQAVERPMSFGQTVKAVAWSFVGLRKGADYQNDVQKLNPVHVIIAGILGAVLFVLAIVLLVQWVVSSGVAR
jgi:amino acid transporter